MKLVTLEYSRFAYVLDFAVFAGAALALAGLLVVAAPRPEWPQLVALAGAGIVAWTALEYLIHRFIMHGVDPVRRWHAEHHHRPAALIGSPTLVSVPLWGLLVFLPGLALGDPWRASALTLGTLLGYLAYAVTHHAVHHSRADTRWLRERRRWHALHHGTLQPVCFGVTTAFWDYLLGSHVPQDDGRYELARTSLRSQAVTLARGLRIRAWPIRMPVPGRRASHRR